MKLLIFVVCCVSYTLAVGQVRYDGHEVLRTYPQSRSQVEKLATLREVFDFWTEPRIRGPTDIRIGGSDKTSLRNFLTQSGIPFEVLIPDVEQLIQEERKLNVKAENATLDWEHYFGVDDIHSWLENIAAANPDIASIQDIGQSTEGRTLKVIKIGVPNRNVSKPAIFMDGGIHAREWIAPAIATWFINELINNRSQHQAILENVDIYVLPTFNVDGYEYSRSNDRMWRKTRSKPSNPLACAGVDPNRNFDHHFGGPGTSTNTCSEIYKGPEAFSEPETRAMSNFILNSTNVNWRIYVALHSYAQMVLTPWGYTYDLPEDYTDLKTLGVLAADALTAVHGTDYEVGSVTEILSPGAGGSDDWAKGSGVFKYSYTLEVRDQGRYGFILPPEQIIPTAEETFEAIKVFARFLIAHPDE